MTPSPEALSFLDHLDELRARLIKILAGLVAASCVFYAFVDPVMDFISRPVGRLVFTAPSDAFVAKVLLSVIGGFIVSLPVTVFQIWRFVAAGLERHERKYIILFAPFSLLLFVLGVVFSYIIAVPISLKFLLGFATDRIVPMITIKSYISFLGTMLLAFGIVFELPLVLIFLTKIGVATPEFLVQKRRYAVVAILVLSALITPPDCVTQLILAVPLILLYEVGILASKLTYKGQTDVC